MNRIKRIYSFHVLGILWSLGITSLAWAQPKAPANLVVTPLSETGIQLNWRPESTETSFFLIERQLNFGNWEILSARPSGQTNSHIDTGLAKGAYYCYRMYAEGISGRSIASDMACALTGKQVEGTPILANIALTDPVTIAIAWAVNQAESYRFRVQRRTPTGGWQTIAEELEKTVWSNTDLDELATYCYRVQGYRLGTTSDFSAEACQTTFVLTPLPVKDLILSNDSTHPDQALKADWKQGDLFRNVVFEVQIRRSGTEWGPIQLVAAPSLLLNNLPNLTQYELRVRARRTVGSITLNSDWVTSGSVSTWLAIWPGDTDGDGQVGPADITRLTSNTVYGKRTPFSGTPVPLTLVWEKFSVNPGSSTDLAALRADANRDGVVDVYDIFPVIANYGRSITGSQQTSVIARITEDHQAELIRRLGAMLLEEEASAMVVNDLKNLLEAWEATAHEETKTIAPTTTALLPNYPNPFSETTNLSWQLAEASSVKIRIIDLLGREQVLVNDSSYPVGTHQITWQPQNLPSGTYFLVFEAKNYHAVRSVQKVR